MEFEQIGKRLEWLDEQQRKGKTDLGSLDERLTALQASLDVLSKQVKSLSKEVSDLSPATARINQFDELMSKQRTDLNKLLDASEKAAVRREQEVAKIHSTEMEEIRKAIFHLGNSIHTEEIEKKFKDRAHEEQRLSLSMQDLRTTVEEAVAQSKDVALTQKALEEARRQDVKRLADLQGELASVRKRADDAREKTTLHSDTIRNVENRINELLETEVSRQDAQTAFLAQQALAQVDRDRDWKDWHEKYEVFKQQAANMETQVAILEDSIRGAKRAQDSYNELNQKLERRISEVGEMQRLAEDRIRQEWVAFKADDQKRWTGNALSQEEAMRDLRKSMDKIEPRLTALDDSSQTLQDQLHQTTDTTEKQLQELMNVSHEWLVAYERIMGHSKAKAKKSTR